MKMLSWSSTITNTFFFLSLLIHLGAGKVLIAISNEKYTANIYTTNEETIALDIYRDNVLKQQAIFGVNTNQRNSGTPCQNEENCIDFGDATLQIDNVKSSSFDVTWKATNPKVVLQDCFNLNRSNVNWYGGPEWFNQVWPIEQITVNDLANVPQQFEFAAITEGYWLNSLGIYVYVHDKVPLFIDQNTQKLGYVCFAAKNKAPFRERDHIMLKYTVGVFDNPKEGHLNAVQRFLKKPTGHPNIELIKNPIWSTWARYYRDINDAIILKHAQDIAGYGFQGQFEIDDDWEKCYGALTFSDKKFSDIKNTVKKIKDLGFSVSLWVHPFVNLNCQEPTEIGRDKDYFVRNTADSILTSWWNSGNGEAQHVDFTKTEAREWFNNKLHALRDDVGIDTFKFDAGESSWPPQPPVLQGDIELSPNQITVDYVRNCATFGNGIEVRSAWRTQDLPVFVRMMDKDSRWTSGNGLYTLITTLLQMNINGYTMVLPDMVGGNGYNGKPSAELFVRWLQANTFMPSIQFSFVPWDYVNHTAFDVLEISRKYVKLHTKFTSEILKAMNRSIESGYPVNAPIWWIDPENPYAHKVDTQYLLGEDIVVAPVIMESHTSRNVYLPKGTWIDGNTGSEYNGNQLIKDYQAPIDILPYFLRKNSDAAALN